MLLFLNNHVNNINNHGTNITNNINTNNLLIIIKRIAIMIIH